MQLFGIDISHWQGDFNFEQAVAEGVQFVILKLGEKSSKDKKFDEYYNKCKKLGLPVGCYYFGNALTVESAEWEAGCFLTMLKDYKFEMPVYYDVEAGMLNTTDENLHNVVTAFCTRVEERGYFTGIYASESVFKRINDSHFTHWVAKWSTKEPTIAHPLWQFGGETNKIRTNKVAGVTCDQDYCYVDFPTIIKNAGLNNFKKEVVEEPKKSNEDIEQIITELKDIIARLEVLKWT